MNVVALPARAVNPSGESGESDEQAPVATIAALVARANTVRNSVFRSKGTAQGYQCGTSVGWRSGERAVAREVTRDS